MNNNFVDKPPSKTSLWKKIRRCTYFNKYGHPDGITILDEEII